MSDRIPCVVPFCRRTRKPNGAREWICGRHWPLVDIRAKRKLARLRRLLRRCRSQRQWQIAANLFDVQWELCKRQAIERAAGISA